MKTNLYNCLGIRESKTFEKKILKLIPKEAKELYLMAVGMKWKQRGSYEYFLTVIADGEEITLREHTHDSTAYNYYMKLEAHTVKFDNWCKNVCLMLIENNSQEILNSVLLNELYLLTEKQYNDEILTKEDNIRYVELYNILSENSVEIPFGIEI